MNPFEWNTQHVENALTRLQMLRSRSEARAGAGEFCDSRAIEDLSKSLP
jgi:hypothetical protein